MSGPRKYVIGDKWTFEMWPDGSACIVETNPVDIEKYGVYSGARKLHLQMPPDMVDRLREAVTRR